MSFNRSLYKRDKPSLGRKTKNSWHSSKNKDKTINTVNEEDNGSKSLINSKDINSTKDIHISSKFIKQDNISEKSGNLIKFH